MTQPSDRDELRAGNADRERVVNQLNNAFAEGRLEVAELEERVAAAYAAKTLGELRLLTADLPPAGRIERTERTERPVPQRATGGEVEPHRDRTNAGQAVAGMAGVFVLNVLIWGIVSVAGDGDVYFWPVWLLIPLGIAVLRAIGVAAGRR